MKCSRCDADLPDSATFCSRCGASSVQGQGVPSFFSYLPPGTPPWPTSVPERLPYVVNAAPVVQSAPVTKTRRETTSGSSGRNVLGIIAVIVLTPILGVLVTLAFLFVSGQFTAPGTNNVNKNTNSVTSPAQTPASTASSNQLPTPTSFKTSKSTAVNLSVQYPSDWTLESPQNASDQTYTSIAVHPAQANEILVIFTRFATGASSSYKSADDLNSTYILSLSGVSGATNIQNVASTKSQLTISGTQWSEKDATFVLNSNTIHFTTISVQHNKLYYNIAYYTPESTYNEALQKYIQPMLQNLQFLS